MPIAAIDINETHAYELKSLEGGKITLRRLPYGKWLQRQEMAMQMQMEMGSNNSKSTMSLVQRAVTEFEFRECIVDHNLEIAEGQLMDFRRTQTLDQLNPRVGEEIAELIRELHSVVEDDSLGKLAST